MRHSGKRINTEHQPNTAEGQRREGAIENRRMREQEGGEEEDCGSITDNRGKERGKIELRGYKRIKTLPQDRKRDREVENGEEDRIDSRRKERDDGGLRDGRKRRTLWRDRNGERDKKEERENGTAEVDP